MKCVEHSDKKLPEFKGFQLKKRNFRPLLDRQVIFAMKRFRVPD